VTSSKFARINILAETCKRKRGDNLRHPPALNDKTLHFNYTLPGAKYFG
jgi:hypothetical protein